MVIKHLSLSRKVQMNLWRYKNWNVSPLSIFYNNNHYITGTSSLLLCIFYYLLNKSMVLQSAWSRIWTHVSLSISYKNNHYLTGTSKPLLCICYIIAEGFRFMPLSLVRLRTFRLSTWVSWVQHWGRSWHGRAHADGGVTQMS